MDLLFEGADDANTPITIEESEQLLLSYVSLRSELNAAEQANIRRGNSVAVETPSAKVQRYS